MKSRSDNGMSHLPISRRALLKATSGLGLTTAVSLGGLTACSTSGASGDWDGSLAFLGWDFQPEQIQTFIDEWSAESGTEVEVSIIPNLGYSAALQTRLRGGDKTDLYYNFAYNTQKFIDSGWAATLNDLPDVDALIEDLFPSSRPTHVTADGDIISVPYFSAVHMLHYNQAMIAEAGYDTPPETLDDIYQQSVAIRDAGLSDAPYLGYWVKEFCEEYFHTYLLNEGIEAFDEDGNAIFAENPRTVAVMEWWQKMYVEGLAPASSISDDPGILSNKMAQGTAAFFVLHHYFLTSIRELEGPAAEDIQMVAMGGENFTFQMGEVLQMADIGNEDAKLEAWELMKYYGWKTPDGEFKVSNGWAAGAGLAAPYPGFFTDEAVVESFPDYYDLELLSNAFESRSKVVPARTLPWYPDFQVKVGDIIHSLLLEEISAEQTVEQLAEAVTTAQEGGGL